MISFFSHLVSCSVLINLCSGYKVTDYVETFPATGEARELESTAKHSSIATRLWAIKLKNNNQLSRKDLDKKVVEISGTLQFVNLGQIGQLTGYYSLAAPNFTKGKIERTLRNHADIDKFEQQKIVKLSHRHDSKVPKSSDPLLEEQWHLYNRKKQNNKLLLDCNVANGWSYDMDGQGVVVAVVDDGVDWHHKDLKDNYFGNGSFNFVTDIQDPTPLIRRHRHGTMCAGVVSASSSNSIGGVGVAYKSRFSAIVTHGVITASKVAEALNYQMNDNHIYSCSWGPPDDGETAESLDWVIAEAFAYGASKGRNSYGSIFVFAAGNGGAESDNCNYDQFVSSIYTIPVTSVTEYGVTPTYGERCTSIMTSTLSGPAIPTFGRSITTTTPLNTFTNKFSGTSASAPLGSGIIALMLQTRPCLYWRDVHHIIAMTSSHVTLSNEVELFSSSDLLDSETQSPENTKIPSNFHKNQAGYTYNDYHGFGFLDAWKVVNAARVWKPVPKMTKFKPKCHKGSHSITLHQPLELGCHTSKTGRVKTIENVVVTVTVEHEYRGMLEYIITCPSGTKSLVATRPRDKAIGLERFVFRTVKCWGESPVGVFKLQIRDTRTVGKAGKLLSFNITVYGSAMTLPELRERWNAVEKSYSDGGEKQREKFQESSLSCPVMLFPSLASDPLQVVTFVLVGVYAALLTLVAVFWIIKLRPWKYFSTPRTSPETPSKTSQRTSPKAESSTIVKEPSKTSQRTSPKAESSTIVKEPSQKEPES